MDKLVAAAPAAGPLPDPIPAILKSAGIHPLQPNVFPDPLWRTFRAVGHTWLAKFVLDAHAKGGKEVPHKILIGACELGGAETLAHVASRVSPSLGDWIKAAATNTPLPEVLPSDAQLAESSEPEITLILSTYA